jgi:hypothetical protein
MADKKHKVRITDTFMYGGKIYHPGPTGVGEVHTDDDGLAEALTKAEARKQNPPKGPHAGDVLHVAESVQPEPPALVAVEGRDQLSLGVDPTATAAGDDEKHESHRGKRSGK